MQESFELQLQQIADAAPKILGAMLALLVLVIAGKIVSNTLSKLLTGRQAKTVKQTRLLKRLVGWGFNLLGIILALNILGLTQAATGFLAAGGVMAVVLGFAFREIGENLLAGLFLSFSRSFDVGDVIESNGIRGVVERIEVREVHIRTGDGCDIFIPSAIIYKNPLHNFTRDGLRRGDFTIGIDYGDDPQKARELLLEVAKTSDFILSTPAPAVQISGFTPTYVELQVFFWINTFNENPGLVSVKSLVMNACHKKLAEEGFTFSSNVTTAVDMLPVDVNVRSKNSSQGDSV
ncbi:mechanosensitive ion channel family protein [Gracilimonas mengyeensis]|uniref:Mechanosensitive ion channel n=1 Tax=Gracilimonas mengyeensis TaxID=1302730 RepID=A0A521FAR3_9BACT|nr:mechanosensitive ion channel [Gracilimonas mengyeensis]SMO93267.1 Mechanosensitive ion channel [Gracilimonas mengyeensis]